ncbi:hypothetical protein N9P58_01915 [Puniceicoccaceae bacterium]|nr:hypothetical protein [Puniceicoccaceae bacterium]
MPITITKSVYETLLNIESVEFEFGGKHCDIQVYYDDGRSVQLDNDDEWIDFLDAARKCHDGFCWSGVATFDHTQKRVKYRYHDGDDCDDDGSWGESYEESEETLREEIFDLLIVAD